MRLSAAPAVIASMLIQFLILCAQLRKTIQIILCVQHIWVFPNKQRCFLPLTMMFRVKKRLHWLLCCLLSWEVLCMLCSDRYWCWEEKSERHNALNCVRGTQREPSHRVLSGGEHANSIHKEPKLGFATWDVLAARHHCRPQNILHFQRQADKLIFTSGCEVYELPAISHTSTSALYIINDNSSWCCWNRSCTVMDKKCDTEPHSHDKLGC